MGPPRLAALVFLLLLSPPTPRAEDEVAGLLKRARQGAAGIPAVKSQEPALGLGGSSTWVFIVSVLEFKDGESFGSFPKENRRDALLLKFFRANKGVPDDHILYFTDANAKKEMLEKRLRQFLKRAGKNDTFFFYYAGHGAKGSGGETYYIPYDAKGGDENTYLSMEFVIDAVEIDFKGAWAFLAGDCCYSGGICHRAAETRGKISYGCLASVESSKESTGNWTFSEALLRALTGSSRVDKDGDKKIVFQEAADFIASEMAFLEKQKSASGTTGRFSPRLKLADVAYQDEPPARAQVSWGEPPKDYPAEVLGACTTQDGRPGKRVHYIAYDKSYDECADAAKVKAAGK